MASRLQISVRDYHLALRAKGQAQLPTWPRLERRHQTIRLRDRHWNPTSVASFRRRRPSPYERNAAISRHFERDPIPYVLETDWPVEAAGFEHLHSRIGIAKTLSSRRQDSNLCILKSDLLHFGVLAVVRDARNLLRSEARAPAIRDAQVRVLSPQAGVLANFDSGMRRFESRRPNRPVRCPARTHR